MACEYICDGCSKRAKASHNGANWFKPSSWFERSDNDGIQTACSRACIDEIARKSGKTGIVIPL